MEPNTKNTESETENLNIVMKNIYSSCDPGNTNAVCVSKLITFVQPYMIQDLSALHTLRSLLDPTNMDVCITSEFFYDVMKEWATQVSDTCDGDGSFNRTPSELDHIDEKDLPYVQSTPRASFGQKLLNGSELLNLSLNSSFAENNGTDAKYLLEEQIKILNHQLSKVSNEAALIRLQLTATEEHNEILQLDLCKMRKQLEQEQHVNENMRVDRNEIDDLQEELSATKQQMALLQVNLTTSEKDAQYLSNCIAKLEEEKSALEKKYKEVGRKEQEARKMIIDVKTEVELKEAEITHLLKVIDGLKYQNQEQKDVLDQFNNENELLAHKNESLEKIVKRQSINMRRSSLGSFGATQNNGKNRQSLNESNTSEMCPAWNAYNSPRLLQQVTNPISPDLNSLAHLNNKLLSRVKNGQFCSTPNESSSIAENLDHSEITASPPILYVVERSVETKNASMSKELSSDEDLYWQFEPESPHESPNRVSLNVEMAKANEKENVSYVVFEKNEHIANLEFRLEQDRINFEKDLKSLEEERKSLIEEVDQLRRTVNAIEEERRLISKKLEEFEDLKAKLEAQITLTGEWKQRTKLLERELSEKQVASQLTNNIEDTMEKIQSYISERCTITDEISESKVKLENYLNSSVGSLQAVIEKNVREIEDLRVSLHQDNVAKKTLWKTIQSLRTDLEADRSCLNEYKSKCEELNKEKCDLQLVYDEIVAKFEDMQCKDELRERRLEKLENDLKESNSVLAIREEKYNGLLVECETVEKALKIEQDRAQQLERDWNERNAAFETAATTLDNLKKEKEQESQEIANLIATIKTTDLVNVQIEENNHVQQLKQMVSLLLKKIEEQKRQKMLDEQNETFERKQVNSFEKQRIIQEKYQMKIENLENLCERNNEKVRLLTEERDNMTDQIARLEESIKIKDIQHSQSIVSLQHTNFELTNELHLSKQQIYVLVKNKEQLQNEYHKLSFDLNVKNTEIEKLNKDKLDLDSELANLKTEHENELIDKEYELVYLKTKSEEFAEFLEDESKFVSRLESVKNELEEAENQLSCRKEELSSLTDFGGIYNRKEKLIGVIKSWKGETGIFSDEFHHILNELDLNEVGNFSSLTEWELYKLQVVLDFAVLLTEFLSEKFLNKSEMDGTVGNKLCSSPDGNFEGRVWCQRTESPDSPFEIENNLSESVFELKFPLKDPKSLKKFTIPKLLVSKPDSPDSPSLEIGTQGDLRQVNALLPHFYENYEDCERYLDSQIPVNQEAFPNVSEAFLESLGLHECDAFKKLDKNEVERLFTMLVVQLAMDGRDTKERKSKQQERCTKMEKQLLNLIKDITLRLRDHKCIGALEPIMPVFLLLEEAKGLLKELVKSAGQYGAICYEFRMMRCWNLATNYAALLRQNVQIGTPEKICQATSSQTNFEKYSKAFEEKSVIGNLERVPSQERIDIPRRKNFSKRTIFMLFFLCIVCLILLEIYCHISDKCGNYSLMRYSLIGPLAY